MNARTHVWVIFDHWSRTLMVVLSVVVVFGPHAGM